MSDFVTPWTAAHQASLFSVSQSLLKLISTESVMPSNHLILCRPLLLLPSIFPSIKVFSNESALCIRWPKYWNFSFSISPWFPLGLTSLIFLQSKGVSRVFSSTTLWKHQFFGAQPSLQFSSHIHTWLLEKPKVKRLWFNRPLSAKWWLRCGGKLREASSREGTGFLVEAARGEWCLEDGLQSCPQPSCPDARKTWRHRPSHPVGEDWKEHSNAIQTYLLVVTGLMHLPHRKYREVQTRGYRFIWLRSLWYCTFGSLPSSPYWSTVIASFI